MKDYFFDREAVMGRVEKARLRMLSKAGAYVRTSARSSLRRRKSVSQPGSPPSVHSTDDYASLKNILFVYDPASDSVVVGPLLVERQSQAIVAASSTVPGLLERGGSVTVRQRQQRDGSWTNVRRFTIGKAAQRTQTIPIAARPFMLPALKTNASKFPNFFDFTG